MYKAIFMSLVALVISQRTLADQVDVICFFPDKLNIVEINKSCNEGDLIRTRPYLAELVCDWDKQIFKYVENGEEWITCSYHGHVRQMKELDKENLGG